MNETCHHVREIVRDGVSCVIRGGVSFGICASCPDSTAIGWECPYLKRNRQRATGNRQRSSPCGCGKGETTPTP